MVSIEQIAEICNIPQSNLSNVFPFINPAFQRFGIKDVRSIRAWIANVSVESAHFKRTLEIASGQAYEGRADLGNTQPGDGPKFKGRGLIQLTGRTVYKQASRDLYGNDCLLITPSILEAPKDAVESACWFWTKYKDINSVCLNPEDWVKPGVHKYSKIQWIRIMVNGGLNGFDEVLANYSRAIKILK